MRGLLRWVTEHRHEIVTYGILLLIVFLISLIFPNHTRFKYEFQEGQVWRYEDLVAPFDFAILKPQSEIDSALAQVNREHAYYFVRDTSVSEQAISNFQAALTQILPSLDPEVHGHILANGRTYSLKGKSVLNKFYALGIMDGDSTDLPESAAKRILAGNRLYEGHPLYVDDALELVRHELSESGLSDASVLYPLIEREIRPNIRFDAEIGEKFAEAARQKISRVRGKVSQGDLIVPKNGLITSDIFLRLLSYQQRYEAELSANKSRWVVMGGYLLLTLLIVGILLSFIQTHHRPVFDSPRKLTFVMLWLVLFSYLVHVVEANGTLSAYMIPFCIAPIVIKTFYNDGLALFTMIAIVLLASFLSSLGYEFTFLQILAGVVAVLANQVTRYSSKFFTTILLIFLAYCLGYLGLSLIKEGSIETVDWSIYVWFTLNVVLTLLAYPLVPLLERVFGFTSSMRLSELADLNKPLLKDLSLKAPGTFQHSLQVGNLAEAALDKIGGDTQLVKVAALYHDIGKIKEPAVFIENQSTSNPHDEMDAAQSARHIIDHVIEGEKMARKARLPQVIIDFINTHHGTTRVEYFYQTFIKDGGDPAEEGQFRYPGPRPKTREQVILMLADSIEAACKSLKEPTESDISDLVDRIIQFKLDQHQLVEAAISFEEVESARQTFKQVLKSIHHIRVEYPEPAR